MKTIQIIEDSAPLRQLLTEFFAVKGYRTIESMDGQEALEMFKREEPDLILLDLLMPHVNGYTVIKEIKKTKETPIIVMSSQAMSDNVEKSETLGADEYIVKPFSMTALFNTVETMLNQSL
ncbi:MAG: response regulator [Chloroflexota bacterium]